MNNSLTYGFLVLLISISSLSYAQTPVFNGGTFTAHATGYHGCNLYSDGTVGCWGSNGSGQICNGETIDVTKEYKIPEISDAIDLAIGAGNTCILRENRRIECCGRASLRAIGFPVVSSVRRPRQISGINNASSMKMSGIHSCILHNNQVSCLGTNNLGQLGNGENTISASPVKSLLPSTPTTIAVGSDFSCASLQNGRVYCWGGNRFGSRGNRLYGKLGISGTTRSVNKPGDPVLGITNSVMIASGTNHTCSLSDSGDVLCWGSNHMGQLGVDTSQLSHTSSPTAISGITNAIGIGAIRHKTCVLLEGDIRRCFGDANQVDAHVPVYRFARYVVNDIDTSQNTVLENTTTGTPISGLSLVVFDPSRTVVQGESISWSLDSEFFTISTSGEVKIAQVLDYEDMESHSLTIQVSVGGKSIETDVVINIINVFENISIIDSSPHPETILENVTLHTEINGWTPGVFDEGNRPLTDVVWSITGDSFEIGNSGIIRSSVTLDYEQKQSYDVTVSASKAPLSTNLDMTIAVTNILESFSLMDSDPSTNTLVERPSDGTTVMGLSLVTFDEGENKISGITWSVSNIHGHLLSSWVVRSDGLLAAYHRDNLNRDLHPQLRAVITASKYDFSDSLTVEIEVLDALQDVDRSMNYVLENANQGAIVSGISLFLEEMNTTSLDDLTWSITGPFQISTSGQISVSRPLDYETSKSHRVRVYALSRAFNASLDIVIHVLNVLESITVSDGDSVQSIIREDASMGLRVPGLSFTVVDEGGRDIGVSFSFSGSNLFGYDGIDGLTLLGSLNYEEKKVHTVSVTASTATFMDSIDISISVENVLESIRLMDVNPSLATVYESSEAVEVMGVSLSVVDEGGVTVYGVTWETESSPFSVSDGILSATGLDYEAEKLHIAIVTVSKEGLTDGISIEVNVLNVLESITLSDSDDSPNVILENAEQGTEVSGVSFTIVDEGGREVGVSFTVSSDVFSVKSNEFLLNGSLDYESLGEYMISVTASTATLTDSISVTVSVGNVLEEISLSDVDALPNAIAENADQGARVSGLSLSAVDEADRSIDGVSFGISGETFAVSPLGVVTLKGSLDYEESPQHEAVVSVSAGALSDSVTVEISVLNVLEEISLSDADTLPNTIVENADQGAGVSGLSLSAVDEADRSVDGVSFGISGETFAISSSGVVTLKGSLDYEDSPQHEVVISASAGAVSDALSTVVFTVNVLESLVIRDGNAANAAIAENASPGTLVSGLSLSVEDEGGRTPEGVTWSITGPFRISSSGEVVLAQPLDYEAARTRNARVSVSVGGISAGLDIVIDVGNVLERLSIVDNDSSRNTVYENSSSSEVAGLSLSVIDERGQAPNGIAWSITGPFAIRSSGEVIAKALDYERDESHSVIVSASRDGVEASADIVIRVKNVLEEISLSDADVLPNMIVENAGQGTMVPGLSLATVDEAGRSIDGVSLGISGEMFDISSSGVVILKGFLDYEESSKHEVVISASVGAVSNSLTTEISTVNVLESLVIRDSDPAAATVVENSSSGTAVAGLALFALDEGGNRLDHLAWSIAGGPFAISDSAEVALSGAVDYEQQQTYDVTISASKDSVDAQFNTTIEIINALEDVKLRLRVFLEGPLR